MNGFLGLIPKVYFPSQIYLGANSLYYLKSLQEESNLILVSRTAWEQHGHLIEKNLAACSNEIKIVSPEPTDDNVADLNELVNKGSYSKLIGFGGGSVMDLAKLIKSQHGIDLILIPTTFGSGSETSQYSIIINENLGKEAIVSEKLLPDVVLLVSTFLATLPRLIIAYSAVDALSHAIEGLVSKRSNHLTDHLAITAIDIIMQNVLIAYEDERNLEAREKLQIAGLLSGIVQSSASVGLIHGCAHYFGPKLCIPHGLAVAIFTIPVLEMNSRKTDRYEKLNESKVVSPQNFIEQIRELFNKLDLHEYHKQFDFSNIEFSDSVKCVKADACTKTNPFVPTESDIQSIFDSMGINT